MVVWALRRRGSEWAPWNGMRDRGDADDAGAAAPALGQIFTCDRKWPPRSPRLLWCCFCHITMVHVGIIHPRTHPDIHPFSFASSSIWVFPYILRLFSPPDCLVGPQCMNFIYFLKGISFNMKFGSSAYTCCSSPALMNYSCERLRSLKQFFLRHIWCVVN